MKDSTFLTDKEGFGADRALVASDEARAGLHPTGFDHGESLPRQGSHDLLAALTEAVRMMRAEASKYRSPLASQHQSLSQGAR